ncbi:MAG: tripartite tricarboxylate transporter substrate binding protein [Pseudomonadota bacterium]
MNRQEFSPSGAMGIALDRRRAIALAAGALTGGSAAAPAVAQGTYPNRPIRLVLPVPPGSAMDTIIRPLGQRVQPLLGQPFILDNKPGAAEILGSQLVAHAPADGYTLLMANDVPFSIMPALGTPMPFDPDRDFVPLTMLAQVSLLLLTGKDFPATNLAEFIAYVKAHPGKLSYGTGGIGSPHHVAMERLMARTGMDMLHVPYQGIPPAFNSLLSGDTDVMLVAITVANEHIRAGRVKALAFTAAQRHPKAPTVPTFKESGYPDYVVGALFGMFAPGNTPPEITRRLSSVLWEAVSSDEFTDNVLVPGGFDPHPSVTPGQFPAFIRDERRKWRDSLARIDPRKFIS